MDEKHYYLGFSLFPGVGPATFKKLLLNFSTAKNAWNAAEKDLEDVIGEKLTEKFLIFRKHFLFEKYLEDLEKKQIKFVSKNEKDFPALLQQISFPPIVLFYKGNKEIFSKEKSIGIVGTRTVSSYGKEVTEMITRELVSQNFVIVSGLALGVDGIAHATALDCHGSTIAVLGSGVDICTPGIHQKLYEKILKENVVVSAFPPGQVPTKGSFPARNKIIAGLSLGIVVTEGTADSGALYTADFAKKMDRPVFAIPGPITSKLSGATTQLLKNGATLVSNSQDILDKLDIMSVRKKEKAVSKIFSENAEEQEILSVLENGSLHFNEIVRRIGKDSKSIGSLLSLMELKGQIKSSGEIYSL